jgi:hypothetical protein
MAPGRLRHMAVEPRVLEFEVRVDKGEEIA